MFLSQWPSQSLTSAAAIRMTDVPDGNHLQAAHVSMLARTYKVDCRAVLVQLYHKGFTSHGADQCSNWVQARSAGFGCWCIRSTLARLQSTSNHGDVCHFSVPWSRDDL